MQKFIFPLIFFIFTSSAFANTNFFEERNLVVTSYLYCNGYLGSGTGTGQDFPGSCSNQLRMGIDIDRISRVKIQFSESSVVYSVYDLDGRSWYANSEYCANNDDICEINFIDYHNSESFYVGYFDKTGGIFDVSQSLQINYKASTQELTTSWSDEYEIIYKVTHID